MTYQEMQQAEAQYLAAITSAKRRRHRGATRGQLAHRAAALGLCVACGGPLRSHTTEQLGRCANARS